jgi:hypothetical protein
LLKGSTVIKTNKLVLDSGKKMQKKITNAILHNEEQNVEVSSTTKGP